MAATENTPYLRGVGLSKSFGHVRALQDVDVDIYEGQVLAIVGDNGAGKSTLTNILSGVFQPDRGEISVNCAPAQIGNPQIARNFGIATVFQNLALVDTRDVACNLFLGREPTRWRYFVDRGKMRKDAKRVIADLRVNVPSISAEAGQLSGGQRQSLAIGRATSQQGRVIIMDEPTAALGVRESRKVLDLILRLRERGNGVVIISHNMRHVFSIFDRIMVLRHGRIAGVRRKGETTPDEIVKLIVGVDTVSTNGISS
jgi:ABC-type sugar transport system ATPase subunit